VHAVRLGAPLWVIHAFQKKSKTGIKTPRQEIEVIRQRLRRLQEER
jgi:phage-related protein